MRTLILKHLRNLPPPIRQVGLAWCNSGWGLQFRSRASAQAGFISSLCPGQHWRLRPFSLLAAAAGFLCKKVAPGQHRREAPFVFARVVQQKRHDVENVASAGANPAASTTFLELKPQQTGTGLLIRYGEVATTSGSTTFCRVV